MPRQLALLPAIPAETPLTAWRDILVSMRFKATSMKDDLITAAVVKPVMDHGRQLIQAGALIEGHVRSNRGDNSVVIQLDRVQTSDGWMPFYAQLLKLGSNASQVQRSNTQGQAPAALFVSDNNYELTQTLLTEHKETIVPQLNTSVSMH
jgi:hypothetical protein